MDAINEGLGVLLGHAVHLPSGGHVFRHRAVCQKHEFLYEPVALLRHGLMDIDGLSVPIYLHLHLRPVEVDGARLRPLVLVDGCKAPQGGDRVFYRGFFAALGSRLVPGLRDTIFLYDILCLPVVETIGGVDDRASYPAALDVALGAYLAYNRIGQLVLVRAQGAKLVTEFLGEHGDGTVHQIDAGAPFAGFAVHCGAGLHVVRYIGYVHAHLVVAVVQPAEGQGVVEVLCVGRVNGEGEGLPEILAALEVLFAYLFGDSVGGVFDLLGEPVRQVEFRQDGMHLGLVLPRHAQHVDQVPDGIGVSAVPAVDHHRHLHALLRSHFGALGGIDLDIPGHALALHEHPGLLSDAVVDAHELLAAPLDYLDYFAFAALGGLSLAGTAVGPRLHFARDGDPYKVPIEGVPGFGRLYVNVVVLAFDQHEGIALAGHLHGSGFLAEDFASAGFHAVFAAFSHGLSATALPTHGK